MSFRFSGLPEVYLSQSGLTNNTDANNIAQLATTKANQIIHLGPGDFFISTPSIIKNHGVFLKGVGERTGFGDGLVLNTPFAPKPTRLVVTPSFSTGKPMLEFGALA